MNTKNQEKKLQKLVEKRKMISEKFDIIDASPLVMVLKAAAETFYDNKIKKLKNKIKEVG